MLPVVFFCENNGYAICTAQAETTAVADIASRAASYNMPGVIVDGQDALAVYDAVRTSAIRAREGMGPSLVEAKTYRFCDHEEDCEFPPYRDREEVALWRTRDPIEILVTRLRTNGELTDEALRAITSETRAEIAAAVSFARESPMPPPEALVEDLFV
jgi:pyruvate dehydrogenase E1 component alpha subunit